MHSVCAALRGMQVAPPVPATDLHWFANANFVSLPPISRSRRHPRHLVGEYGQAAQHVHRVHEILHVADGT